MACKPAPAPISRWDLLPYEIRSKIYSFHRDPKSESVDYRKLMKPILRDIWCTSWLRWMLRLDCPIKQIVMSYVFYMWTPKFGDDPIILDISTQKLQHADPIWMRRFPDTTKIEIFVYDVNKTNTKKGVTIKVDGHTLFRAFVLDQEQYERMVEEHYPMNFRYVNIRFKTDLRMNYYIKNRSHRSLYF